MPTQVVDVDLQTETGAVSQRTYSDLVVVASNPTIADPTYNQPNVYDSASSVAADFGDGSDAHVASQQIESRGVRRWWVVMLESTDMSETVGDSDSSSTDEGAVDNAPMQGGTGNVTVTLDSTEQTLVPSTGTPPSKPDAGNAAVNFDTGEVVTGESSTGSDSGIVVEYQSLSWDDAFTNMDTRDLDLVILGDTHADRSYIGELDELAEWSSGQNASMVAALENGGTYDTDEDAMAAAHETAGYLSSGDVMAVAHKSDDDVAAGIAGRLATKQAWFDPYMDGSANYSFSMDEYRRALIGDPSTPGSFEGGDNEGSGPVNVLYTEQGHQILSNSLSTAGSDSDYQFFDVARTEAFIRSEIKDALRGLKLSAETIPFAPVGRTMIESSLRNRLNQYVSASGRALSTEEVEQLEQQLDSDEDSDATSVEDLLGEARVPSDGSANVPLSELSINVPRYDDLSPSARADRRWSGITIQARLAGNAHTFGVTVQVTV